MKNLYELTAHEIREMYDKKELLTIRSQDLQIDDLGGM